MATFTVGQPVIVTFQDGHTETGKAIWQRMALPRYNQAAAVSVLLPSRDNHVSYVGSVFPAKQVQAIQAEV